MITSVIKRNGKTVPFDENKIYSAISCAYTDVYGNIENKEDEITEIVDGVVDKLADFTETMSIETIQDIIENEIANKDFNVARSYITYRYSRKIARNTTDTAIMELIAGENEYWNTENSNKNAGLVTTQRDYLAGITSTDITNRILLPKKISEAHAQGILHFHDADYFVQRITNCCLINLDDMLQNGTIINKVKIDKPKKLITATTIATQIITAVASSQYGGTSTTLAHLAPFVRDSYNIYLDKYKGFGFDDETCRKLADYDLRREIKDAVQTFNYQINSMSTTNGQAPFISVFMYINENPEYRKETAMLIEEFLNQRMLGMKNEVGVYVTQAFPKLLYVLDEDNINEDSEYYWLTARAAYCTAKRMNPDYISAKVMKETKDNAIFPCMGCRSFLANVGVQPNVANALNYDPTKPKFYGRFNQGVVTLNLVDVALSSKKDMVEFWRLLDERSELCREALLCRHNRLKGTLSDVAPILWQHGAFARLKSGEKIDKLLTKDYSSISLGYAGLYECVLYMLGESHTTVKGKCFALNVMNFLADKCEKWKEEDNLGYSTYGTPIESTTYKFAQKLQKRFGVIEGITDKDYITNSYHVNVKEKINPFDKLTFEGEFMRISTGGSCSYIEADDLSNNVPAIMQILKHMYKVILYAEINTKSDYCQVCGYDGEIKIIDENGKLDWECPNCHNRDKSKLNVSRRTCGYIGTNFWNQGRTQEIKERYVHLTDHEVIE